ncbi:unnamed protein product [Scytosiphon promiscuus]
MSIGILHVKVVEARGLMARDGILGRSDPYAKLEVTGRYLSSGQEWSENLRIREQTKTIKYSLNPIWNEEFSLPVRRSGAVLRVELWDWDRNMKDDSLGSFEVKIGEELLSQKTLDMWYVLETPADLRRAESPVPDVKLTRSTEMEAPSEVEEEFKEEEEAKAEIMEGKWKSVLRKGSLAGERHRDGHDHGPEEEPASCEACIESRRKRFGEVRLQLRYEFDEFAETCSHIWPEEAPKSPEMAFSPNRVYYNALLLQQLARPYIGCMQRANAVVHWVHPLKSLLWFAALVVLLLRPCLLIVAINGSLLWIVVSNYLNHLLAQRRAAGVDSGDIEEGLAAKSKAIWKTWGDRRKNKLPKKRIPEKSMLPQIDAPEDLEMQEMYRTVRRTKKLPAIVEEIGRRTFADDGLPPQRQVETAGRMLTKIRRVFHPVNGKPCVLVAIALFCHTILQLWLYINARFHLYFVVLLVAIFSFDLYSWRGRAFLLAVREAVRCRQTRIALNRASSGVDGAKITQGGFPEESDSPGLDGEEGVPSPKAVSTSEEPLFAPPGTTVATDAPQGSARHRRGAAAAHKARSHSAGAVTTSDPNDSRETSRTPVLRKKVRFASFDSVAEGTGASDASRRRNQIEALSEEGPDDGEAKAPAWLARDGGVTPQSRTIDASPLRANAAGFRSMRSRDGRKWSGVASFGSKSMEALRDAQTSYGSTVRTRAVAEPLLFGAGGGSPGSGGGGGGDEEEGDESVASHRIARRTWRPRTNDGGTRAGENDRDSYGSAFLGRELEEDKRQPEGGKDGWRNSFSKWYKR